MPYIDIKRKMEKQMKIKIEEKITLVINGEEVNVSRGELSQLRDQIDNIIGEKAIINNPWCPGGFNDPVPAAPIVTYWCNTK
jgi:hypothetical protein